MPSSERRVSFDPQALEALQTAFNSAWHDLLATGNLPVSDAARSSTRVGLAKKIFAAAQLGERDPAALKLAALQSNGQRFIDAVRQSAVAASPTRMPAFEISTSLPLRYGGSKRRPMR